jgi:phosphoserine phosphatase RsbU/P
MPGTSPAIAPAAIENTVRLTRIDASTSQRTATLLDLVAALSSAAEPGEVLRAYAHGIARLRGQFGYVSLSTRGLAPGQYRITRLLTPEKMAALSARDAWPVPPNLPVHTGGLLGEIISEPRPAMVEELNLANDPVVGDAFARYRSFMAIPLFDGGEALNWAILLSETPRAYATSDVEDALLRGNLVGGTVRTVLLARELSQANARIRREIDQIARIQRSLLPDELPTITGLTLAAHYETFDQAGGDYYDFLPLKHREDGSGRGDPDAPWGILIADASGHGPAAAVMMAMVHAILHAYPSMPFGPAEVLDHLNSHLCAKRLHSCFVTAFLAIYDPPTRALTYARAGHEPPLLKSPGEGGPVVRLDAVGSVPLGILKNATHEEASIVLEPGQSVVLYTDGITDASCPDGTRFGLSRLEHALTECTGNPGCVVESVTAALNVHEQCMRPNDDQTIVVLRVNEAPRR